MEHHHKMVLVDQTLHYRIKQTANRIQLETNLILRQETKVIRQATKIIKREIKINLILKIVRMAQIMLKIQQITKQIMHKILLMERLQMAINQ